jgi:hypothetical protein
MDAAGNIVLLELSATAATAYQSPSVTNLKSWLRMRLNDLDAGDWSDSDLLYALNISYQETTLRTRCHSGVKSLAVVANTPTYDFGPTFLPVEIQLGDSQLKRQDLRTVADAVPDWDRSASDTPTRWFHLTGTTIRIHPTPDSGAAGIIGTVTAAPVEAGTGYAVNDVLLLTTGGSGGSCKVTGVAAGAVTSVVLVERGTGYSEGTSGTLGEGTGCTIDIATLATLDAWGYTVDNALVAESDEADVIPGPYAVPSVLDRAEAECRKMRPTHQASIVLVPELFKRWDMWCDQIVRSIRGGD